MRCHEFERRLQQLLDDQADGSSCADALPSALESHTVACEDCRTLVDGYRKLFVGLAAIEHPPGSERFVRCVVAQAKPQIRRANDSRWLSSLATAASITLVVSLAMLARFRPVQPAPEEFSLLDAADHNVVAVPIAEVKRTTTEDHRSLEQTSFGVALNLAGLRPIVYSAGMLESHLSAQPTWMVEVTDDLKPVADSMTDVLNALLRVFPGNAAINERDQGASYEPYRQYGRLA